MKSVGQAFVFSYITQKDRLAYECTVLQSLKVKFFIIITAISHSLSKQFKSTNDFNYYGSNW